VGINFKTNEPEFIKMNKTYKAVLIGCGARAPAHIEAYNYIEGAEAAACYAPTPAHREALAAKYGLTAYDSLEKMLEKEKPDIVHIITKPSLRYSLMKIVSDAGVPLCTVEKPIATAVDDWRSLVELGRSGKTLFGVSHQVRWQPNLVKCRKALDNFGALCMVDMSCGMNISGQGTHVLNYGRYLAGDLMVKSVFANAWGWDDSDPYHSGPKTSEAYIRFENGIRGLWTSGFVSPRCGDPDTVWQHVHVGAFAEHGRVDYEEFGKWVISGPDGSESGDYGDMDEWERLNAAAQGGFHRAMIEWLETGREAGTSLRFSLHEWAVVLAMYQSALTHKPVDLDGFSPESSLVADLEQTLRNAEKG
jgi:predicted dehydrogenase